MNVWLALLIALLGAGAGWTACAVFGAAFECGHRTGQHVRGDLLVLDWDDPRTPARGSE